MAHVRTFETDFRWAAGLFEGEGHARAHGEGPRRKDGTRHLRFTLQVGMVDLDVLEKFKDRVGKIGNIIGPYPRQGGRTKPIWQWYASKGPALQVAHGILPFLCVRRRTQMKNAILESYGPRA